MARRKPADPQEIAARRLVNESRRAAKADADRLTATGCEATLVALKTDEGTRWTVKAERKDVFKLLLDRRALNQESFDAVRDYEYDRALSQGLTTPKVETIKGSPEGAPGQNIGQLVIDAGKRAARVKAAMYAHDFALLEELLSPAGGSAQNWRATVRWITGETDDGAQSAIVRQLAKAVYEARTQRKEAA